MNKYDQNTEIANKMLEESKKIESFTQDEVETGAIKRQQIINYFKIFDDIKSEVDRILHLEIKH